MKIATIDLKSVYLSLKSEVDAAVFRVLHSGQYVGGPEVEGLEREFAEFCGVPHAVGVSSGTDALRFALMAAGVGEAGRVSGAGEESGGRPVDEVLTSPLTFIATAEAITQAGGKPVFVDVDPRCLNLEPRNLEGVITSRTRAILPVHLYGQPADMDPILLLAKRHGLAVVEDACQAHGATYGGRAAGSLGDAGCFSFYPSKNLGACGEAGMVTTGSAQIAERVRRLRDHGQTEKYRHAEEGYNGRLDALQAAILRVKLRRLTEWNERRRVLAERYRAGLRDLVGRGGLLALPEEMPGANHVYHIFAIRVAGRDRVREALRQRGIETGLHYPMPLHLQPAYAWIGLREGSLPQAERAAREVLTLPLYPEMAEGSVDQVCETLRDAIET